MVTSEQVIVKGEPMTSNSFKISRQFITSRHLTSHPVTSNTTLCHRPTSSPHSSRHTNPQHRSLPRSGNTTLLIVMTKFVTRNKTVVIIFLVHLPSSFFPVIVSKRMWGVGKTKRKVSMNGGRLIICGWKAWMKEGRWIWFGWKEKDE